METNIASPSKAARVTGWILAAPPLFMLLMSGVMKIMQTEEVVKGFASWPAGSAIAIGIVEIACTIVFLVPRTAVLGALLLVGYLGGAVAVTVQAGFNFAMPLACGVMIWGSVWLRVPRVRTLTPLQTG